MGFARSSLNQREQGFLKLRDRLISLALFISLRNPWEHPKTKETRKRYITLLREMGQYDEAASLEAMQSEPTKTEEEQERHPEE